MAVADTHANDHHDHDHHDHGEFIAHHFDSAEQQFDSGKLGIWVFLVTEVLFFSGLFVAYILYRNHHPEIFEQAHVFLDKWLGGLNTVVLLFSSLTMALGVRAAQLGKNKQVALMVLITMVCAAVFLGVKAVEYSHKWDMGILVRSAFDAPTLADALNNGTHPEQTMIKGFSDWLVILSIVPTILLVVFAGGAGVAKGMNNDLMAKFLGCMVITVGGYFLGLFGGYFYQEATAGHHDAHAQILPTDGETPMVLHALTQDDDHAENHDAEENNHAEEGDHGHEDGEGDHDHAEGDHGHDGEHHGSSHGGKKVDPSDYNRDIGIFFSIYYCMTGLHAIHIIGGIAALAWILYRSLAGHWRPDYFGPVDFVGLYWHLVDLIWIYLFPMLYLID